MSEGSHLDADSVTSDADLQVVRWQELEVVTDNGGIAFSRNVRERDAAEAVTRWAALLGGRVRLVEYSQRVSPVERTVIDDHVDLAGLT